MRADDSRKTTPVNEQRGQRKPQTEIDCGVIRVPNIDACAHDPEKRFAVIRHEDDVRKILMLLDDNVVLVTTFRKQQIHHEKWHDNRRVFPKHLHGNSGNQAHRQ